MKTGEVIRMRKVRAHGLGPQVPNATIRLNWAEFKAHPKHHFAFLYIGHFLDGSPIDPVAWLKSLGWTPPKVKKPIGRKK